MRVPLGLRGRSTALCVVLVLTTAGALGTALIWQNYSRSLAEMRKHALIHVQAISRTAEPAVLLNDRVALNRVVHAAAQDPSVERAVIYDANGRQLGAYQQQGTTKPSEDFDPRAALAQPITRSSIAVQQRALQLRIVAPIWREALGLDTGLDDSADVAEAPADAPVGFVCLTYGLQDIEQELTRRILGSAAVAALVVIVGIVATLAGVRQLLRPLRDLVRTTGEIAHGNRAIRARERAVGELGDLACSFNHMADHIETAYAEIEQKVVARTTELEARQRQLEKEITERQRAEDALRAGEQRLRRLHAGLVELSHSRMADRGDLKATASEVTEVATRTLEIDRVGVWLLTANRAALRCFDLYDRREGQHSDGIELNVADYPTYFAAIEQSRTLAAHDARSDPRTKEFAAEYFLPMGIGATLDAPIRVGRRFVGVICHEHVGGTRGWTLEEEQFAGSLADCVALALEAAERSRAELQLREAKEVAEAASRAKSDFLANMSHEIRTPLTAILGFTETLLDAGLSEPQRLAAGLTIRRNGEHLLQIIGDILDISRIEAGQLRVEHLPCPVARVVSEVESLMRARAIEKALSFEIEYVDPIPEMIETDPTRLRQILVNLAANAIKFTASGRVQLRIGLDQACGGDDATEPHLRFDIIDTGIGMTPEQVQRVFQPFTQADETMTRRFGGTGLGLAISQRLAHKFGGTITIASAPGEGSTFTLTLPAGRIAGVRYIQPGAQCVWSDHIPAPPTEGHVSLAGCRVLLAEDGPDNQRLIVYLLEKAGAEVAAVDNGARAVEAAYAAHQQSRPFHVVLMDMQMPVMDGYAATRRLRSLGYTRPIIALTAHAMEGDSRRCREAGCDDYAAKPIDRRALLEAIARHMEPARTSIPSA